MSTKMKIAVVCLAGALVGIFIYAIVPQQHFVDGLLGGIGAACIIGFLALVFDKGWPSRAMWRGR